MLVGLALVIGCDEGTASFETPGSSTTVTKTGSGGGFSADLAKQMGRGAGSSVENPGSGSAVAGSGSAGAGGSGGAAGRAVAAGSAVATGSDSGSASAGSGAVIKAGSGSAVATGSGSAVKAGSGSAVAAGSASAVKAGGSAVSNAGSATVIPPINTNAPRVAIKPSAEIAAIKLSMSPNWDRDVGEAGTISLVVKVSGREETRVFSFRYGYEDVKAPTDRDAYKKWLADNRILTASLDRQRGAAWYIEGVDGSGGPVFRIVVNYGGRKLICGGSLYKDATSNQLGDIRDKTIIQAKEICETVAL